MTKQVTINDLLLSRLLIDIRWTQKQKKFLFLFSLMR
jgi:hypothetical protein